MKAWLPFVFALHLPLCGLAVEKSASAETKLDVIYKTVGKRSLRLDLHYPSTPQPGAKIPFVVFTHGGGWAAGKKTIGDRGSRFEGVQALNREGFCVASVEYRHEFSNQHETISRFPRQCLRPVDHRSHR